MVSHEVSFEDELDGFDVTVFVETVEMYDGRKLKKDNKGLFLCMCTEISGVPTAAYIPREQAKQIIEAMKEVLDEK